MIFTIVFLSIVLLISLIFGIIQYLARVKNEKLMMQMLIKGDKALKIMHHLDNTGAFQSDDEVGKTFLLITEVVQEYRNYFLGKVTKKAYGKNNN